MISLEDCVAMCGLSEAEILAISEHEHVPEIIAAGLASSMLTRAHGSDNIRHIIVEDIQAARSRGDLRHTRELLACLKHFLDEHPEAIPASVHSPKNDHLRPAGVWCRLVIEAAGSAALD